MARNPAMTEVEYRDATSLSIGEQLLINYGSVYGDSEQEIEATMTGGSGGDSEVSVEVETMHGERYKVRWTESETSVLTERKRGWMRVSEEGSVEVLRESEETAEEPEEHEDPREDPRESEPAESEEEPAEEGEETPAAEFTGTVDRDGDTLLQYRTESGMPVLINMTGRDSAEVRVGAENLSPEVREAIAADRGILEWSLGSEILADESMLPEWLLDHIEEPEPEEEPEPVEESEDSEEAAEDTAEPETAESEEEPAEEAEESEGSEEVSEQEIEAAASALTEAGLLTESQARVWVAREAHGLGRQETADLLDMAPSTTDTNRRRARDKVESIKETADLLGSIEGGDR